MFLKTLQIKGFKSFADATSLQLEPGVTVVVGPNGSGKSNVVDAIGWVLGAQAPSAVRSQKMDDVIFAGSSKRPALGRAEVSLTIDNSSGILPIEFTEVTISRTLFRSGDSEYAINGVPCRLLDVTELLSDSGVGRQQHVIISQGQIDAVLNARPEDRRGIIEEAAGVLKFRRRKEKAERRLASTEANLTRVQDLLREVRRQLRPLERQADAARRYGAVVDELTALRLHLAGREIARLRTQLAEGQRDRSELRAEERRIQGELAQLDAAVLAAEVELTTLGGPDVGDTFVRAESMRERSAGLAAVLSERARHLDREREAFIDTTVVATLESEHARLVSEIEQLDAEVPDLERAEVEAAAALAEVEHRRREVEEQISTDETDARSALAEARAELAATTSARARAEADLALAHERLGALERRRDRVETERTAAAETLEAAASAAPGQDAALAIARADAAATTEALASANEAATATAAERHRCEARAEALAAALDAARRHAGAERLASLDGVLGTLLELIEVDEGWAMATEAALQDALDAVVVEDPERARRALAAMADGVEVAVVVAGAGVASQARPTRGEPVRPHVRSSSPGVERLLDLLVGHVVCGGGTWQEACDLAITTPASTVVSLAGDRFSPAGWVVGRPHGGATGVALTQARADAIDAASRADASATRHRGADDAARAAAERLAAAERDVAESGQRAAAAAVTVERCVAERAETDAEFATAMHHLDELAARIATLDERRGALELRLPDLEAEEADREALTARRAAARADLARMEREVGASRTDLEVRRSAHDERRRLVEERIEAVEARLTRHDRERRAAGQRRTELDARAAVVARLADVVMVAAEGIDGVLGVLREARRRHSARTRDVGGRLDDLRGRRQAAERELAGVRERSQRAEIAEADTTMRIEAATELLRRDLDCEPDRAMEAPLPEIVDGSTPAARVRELERDLRVMGPINPLALEEFAALTERSELLESQLEDVRSARRELSKVIRAVDEEIVTVFASAFADVAENFSHLFETLFPGGTGRLALTEPHDLLNTGIELEARPSGKNVKKLSLLSGGERSLTALAYLFAVFRSRPSPFYVMDEVEAALDDVNLHRFLGLVAEFRSTAQLVIVSHQKRTMEAADVLYGVTMEPGGSSKVLSERAAATID